MLLNRNFEGLGRTRVFEGSFRTRRWLCATTVVDGNPVIPANETAFERKDTTTRRRKVIQNVKKLAKNQNQITKNSNFLDKNDSVSYLTHIQVHE